MLNEGFKGAFTGTQYGGILINNKKSSAVVYIT